MDAWLYVIETSANSRTYRLRSVAGELLATTRSRPKDRAAALRRIKGAVPQAEITFARSDAPALLTELKAARATVRVMAGKPKPMSEAEANVMTAWQLEEELAETRGLIARLEAETRRIEAEDAA